MLVGTLRYLIALAGSILIAAMAAFPQSQDGQIEGTATDQNGAAVVGAQVTATNTETGLVRIRVTDAGGFYRMPLLPLGTYRVVAESPNFKRAVREGVTLVTGQTATVDLRLTAGGPEESVIVSADAPIADAGKTDLGRVMNSREVHNIPLPTRNPYNFTILNANVTGRPNRGFNYPQVNTNGFARRVNYLLDGNTNTQHDRAGPPLMMMSEVFVNEIRTVTNAFAPEFGNTTGMIVNMVTPSGTNDLRGSAVYFFRRPSFYARPFFFSAPVLPDNVTNNFKATVGGPIVKNRWHFYFGYEYIKRDDSTRSNRQVTIKEEDKNDLIALGLPASIFVPAIPSQEYGSQYIFRTDVQLNAGNSLMAKFNYSDMGTDNNINGGINTMERSTDIANRDGSLGLQLVSFTQTLLNELRFQYARRFLPTERNPNAGPEPSVTIPNVASFGSPGSADAVSLVQATQVQDNFTLTRGSHAIKFGGGFNFIDSYNRQNVFSRYEFPDIDSYSAAKSGITPRGYTRYDEAFGDPETTSRSTYWNFYVQDDWKPTRSLKLNYGLRYDLYIVPEADPSAPYPASRTFKIDKNNFAPRLAISYSLREGRRPLVLRAGAGLYYEPPFLDMYDRALLENGAPKFFTIRFCGALGGSNCPLDPLAPAFPNTFSGSLPPGSILPRQDIVTVASDFQNMYAIHSNIQLEQALTDDLSLAVGYVHSGGRHIPVYRNINPINPTGSLADGRPVFDPAVSATTRADPRFNIIQMAEAAGVSQYDGLTLQLTQRFSRGIQFSANYTFSRAIDDAPEQNVTYMIGGNAIRLFVVSDPTDRSLDKGYSYSDQRHTFVMSMVARPKFNAPNKTFRSIINNNQFGIIAMANSGERFTIAAGRVTGNSLSPLDLNLDGLSFSDRPVGIKRNSGKTPPQFNLDLRYSRLIALTDRYRLEAIAEIQNLFNINCIVAYNNLLAATNPTTGELIGGIPDFRARNQSLSQESRQLQLGIKFIF